MRRLGPIAAILLASSASAADVVINEIMYHGADEPEVEYVELYNAGGAPVDLAGWYLLDDDATHTPCPLAGLLEPGAYLVVAGDLAAFAAAYPGIANVNPNPFGGAAAGQGFGLGNSGDAIRLFDAAGKQVDRVDYTDDPPWPPEPDGGGPSLELIHPSLDNRAPSSWRASAAARPPGSPGRRNTVFVADLAPAIGTPVRSPSLPRASDTVTVTAKVADGGAVVTVDLFVDEGAGFVARAMADDGLHGDGAAGDGLWGARIEPRPTSSVVRYYVAATDDAAQTSASPAGAPADWYAYTVGYLPPPVRINEILAINDSGAADGAGDRDDWLELRNPGPDPVSLQGMFLSNAFEEPRRFALPGLTLMPGERVVFWADAEPLEGPFHANFRLAGERGAVALFDSVEHGNVLVHGFTYGPQSADVSFGYRPEDSDAPEYLSPPTPAEDNSTAALHSPVCVNEFMAASALGVPDWVELYNRGAETVDLGGWHLSDDPALPARFVIPAGTLLAPGDFALFDEAELGFGFSADGSEVVLLTGPDGVSGADWFDFERQLADVSQGRLADGTPNWHRFSSWTAATPNRCPTGAAGPAPVAGLRFDAIDALRWEPVAGARAYDVVSGSLAALRASGGDFSTAVGECVENNGADTATWVPDGGDGAVFYLVRGVDFSCGFGSFDSGAPSQAAPRDGAAGAPASCP